MISQLTSNQLDIINKVITVLTPVEEITQSISSDASSASVIIPFIRALRKHLEDHDEADRGVRTMKEQMLTSLNRRYRNIETNEAVALATLLDPCFKDRCFSSSGDCARAKDILCEKVEELSGFCNEITREPVPKRPKTNVVQYLSEILDEGEGRAEADTDTSYDTASTVDRYLADPLVPFQTGASYKWWNENKACFPALTQLAKQYLSAPPTSVQSERLFSSAGDIYSYKRNRLAPEKAEMFLFIKCNYNLINSLMARDAFLRHFIKVPERPGTHLCVINVFNAKQA